jgi:hypothetical protein
MPQNMEYKYLELLACTFEASPDEYVRQHVSWRYNTMKSRAGALQARLTEVLQLVKVKSPSVLLQLQRTPGKPAPGSLSPGSTLSPLSMLKAASGSGSKPFY